MSRGDRREKILLDDVDRHDFVKTLAEACQKTGWQVHAYCLMPNHYQVVLETPEPNLAAGMAWLQSTYTIPKGDSRAGWLGEFKSGQRQAARLHAAHPASGRGAKPRAVGVLSR
jgi:REP element-mobilizing transposase RayT